MKVANNRRFLNNYSQNLLVHGSIPELAIRRRVLGQDTYRLFSVGVKQSSRCGGQPDERLANRTQKSALH